MSVLLICNMQNVDDKQSLALLQNELLTYLLYLNLG